MQEHFINLKTCKIRQAHLYHNTENGFIFRQHLETSNFKLKPMKLEPQIILISTKTTELCEKYYSTVLDPSHSSQEYFSNASTASFAFYLLFFSPLDTHWTLSKGLCRLRDQVKIADQSKDGLSLLCQVNSLYFTVLFCLPVTHWLPLANITHECISFWHNCCTCFYRGILPWYFLKFTDMHWIYYFLFCHLISENQHGQIQ